MALISPLSAIAAICSALGCATFGCASDAPSTSANGGSGGTLVSGGASSGGASGAQSTRGGSGNTTSGASNGGLANTGGTTASAGGVANGGAPSGGSSTGGAGGTGTAGGAGANSGGAAGAGGNPSALPSRLVIGWGAGDYNDTWAKNSGTKYDVQWLYLTGQSGNNWFNGFGYGAADGSSLDGLLTTIDGHGFIPGIHLYNVGYGHDQGDAGLVTEIQNPTFSKNYFSEFKVMLQKLKNFGKPVIIVLEGDSFGMIEMLTNNNPNTMAAVASTGLPELADLPNTVAGFGMAYLAMRKAVGVTNVVMGPDTPYYAANGDIMNYTVTDALQPHVDFQYSFFGKLGVGANQTGDRFDFSASCPRAADQDVYTDGRSKWSASDSASVGSASINRYVEWLRLYNQTSGRPWVLHQVPIGNSQHLDTAYSSSTPRSGYKDILVEYLFSFESPASPALRATHVGNFVHAGVIGMLFGFSDDGDQPTNDLWTDNQPFFNTHVKAFLQAGGYPL